MAHLARTRVHRSLAATLIGLALLALMSACGMNAQTTQPYTPAEGVNTNIGPTGKWVQVRNLMILSRSNGEGFLSASIVASESDALTAVTGNPIKTSGDAGAPFTADVAKPLTLPAGKLVILTEQSKLITVKSADLMVGGEAELTLSFANVGDQTIRVPVVDASQPDYATITPSPAAPTPTPTPSS